MRLLRAHGANPKYHHKIVGCNFRLDELQAAVLRVKALRLSEWNEARRRNAVYYDELVTQAGLTSRVTLPFTLPDCRHTYTRYVIRTANRDALRQRLTLSPREPCDSYLARDWTRTAAVRGRLHS